MKNTIGCRLVSLASVGVLVCLALIPLSAASRQPQFRKRWTFRISQKLADVPLESSIPVSIFAMAFSPDGQRLAFSAGFTRVQKDLPSNSPSKYPHKSYVFVFDADVGKLLRRFEIKMAPYLTKPAMFWDPAGIFVVLQAITSNDHEIEIVRADQGEERIVSVGDCILKAVLKGERLLTECSDTRNQKSYMRIFSFDGELLETREVPAAASILAVAADSEHVIVDRRGSAGPRQPKSTHEIALLSLNGTERHKWRLPDALWYDVAFAEKEKRVCALSRIAPPEIPQATCMSVETGAQLSQFRISHGHSSAFVAGGMRGVIQEEDVHHVPGLLQRLAETEWTYGRSRYVVRDLQTGASLSEWDVRTQHLLPKPAWALLGVNPVCISPNGKLIAEGGEGIVTVYDVP